MQYIGCLGPRGSFSEEALECFLASDAEFDSNSYRVKVYASIPQLLQACDQKEVLWGFVPLENSIDGQVGVTMDLLVQSENLYIAREFNYPISQCLLTARSIALRDINKVFSHEQALGQCREFLQHSLAHAEQIVCSSTAEAARIVSLSSENWAAIAPKRAAQLYELTSQRDGIQDVAQNETRFVLVGHSLPELTGTDKTSLLVVTDDSPGALCRVFNEFAIRQLNLTRIESRPSKQKLGEYKFFIDVEGYVFSPDIQHALWSLKVKRVFVRCLGSYPKAPGPTTIPQLCPNPQELYKSPRE